jgi:hypothetical protein
LAKSDPSAAQVTLPANVTIVANVDQNQNLASNITAQGQVLGESIAGAFDSLPGFEASAANATAPSTIL